MDIPGELLFKTGQGCCARLRRSRSCTSVGVGRAPHRLFYRQLGEIDALKTSSIQASTASVADVKEELTILFMKCPVLVLPGDLNRDFAEFSDWFDATLARLRVLLRTSKIDLFYEAARPFIEGEYRAINNRTEAAFSRCRLWLNVARKEVSRDDINPDYRVECRPFASQAATPLGPS